MSRETDPDHHGFGARRGWRAPKGDGARKGRRASRASPPRPSTPADPTATDVRDPTASALAGLWPDDGDLARRLARVGLPAPGAPDALTGALRALGRITAEIRGERDAAREERDDVARRRERDAERADAALARAREQADRAAAKARREQGERQRISGDLERALGRLDEVTHERDRLRADAGDRATDDHHGRDAPEVAALRARVAALEAQLEERALALEELTDAHEAASAEAERMRTASRRLRRLAVEAGADIDLVDHDDHAPLRVDDLPAVHTVLDAVLLAREHADHLIYTDRALDTARTAPYDEPRKLLRDLLALDRVAAAWATPGGVGRPMRDVAVEQQLEWADDVSDSARQRYPHEYRFTHDGRVLWAGPHVKVATGRGMRRTCRVYLAMVKGDEPDLAGLPRGVYVGPVGKHLSDTTTG
ncbi:MAG: hypothetical protein M0P31_09480 [Solirubrobacteraceae bacterium]|nr:hypothetical protein [Solirubrobacteraceae bacterium]